MEPAVQTTLGMVEFQLEDVFLVIFILIQHGQRAQRGGVLHPGTINSKNGTLKGGKTKNGGISDENGQRQSYAQPSARRLVRGRQSEKVSTVVKFT